MEPVYLDHAATTPLAAGVLDAMLPFMGSAYGNASSVHTRGRKARHAVEAARDRLADAFGVEPSSVWITSGGTEANNTALFGMAALRPGPIVTSSAEHEAVIQAARRLDATGRSVRFLTPGTHGSVRPGQVADGIDADTALVSVMLANNEVGTRSPIGEISTVCRRFGVPLHTDAVQMGAYADVSPEGLGADLVTVSSHKLGGPVGVGALLLRSGVECDPLIVGGAQERGRRGGTENVAAIVGFAEAARRAASRRQEEAGRVRTLRDLLAERLTDDLGDLVTLTTPSTDSAPHILHCLFQDREGRRPDGEMLILALDMDGLQVSAGSACSSGAMEPSHVLLAMGRTPEEARSALRFSLGHTTTAEDIERASSIVTRVVRRLLP